MTLIESFKNWLATTKSLTFGQDLFIGEAPSSNKVQAAIYWLVAQGGSPQKNITADTINSYTIYIYYRNRDYKSVYDVMGELEGILNCASCVDLEDYDTLNIEASVLSVDTDLDQEDRKVGLLQVNIRVHTNC